MRTPYVIELPDNRVAFINADLTPAYIRDRYEGEGGAYAFAPQVITLEQLGALQRRMAATPRLTYQPERAPLSVNIPFSGFYESLWSGIVDSAETSHCEYESERECSQEYYPETYQPEPLQLDASDFADASMGACDYHAAHQAIARDYVETFGDWMSEQMADLIPGFAFPVEFEEMTSPREYNFATDRLFAMVPYTVMRELFELSESNGHGALRHLICERFTSYDGFISSYQTDLDEWLAKPLEDWDHNELATLVGAAMALADPDMGARDLSWAIYEHGNFGDNESQYFDAAMNWPKYEAAIAEAREEKREAAIEAGLIEAEPESDPAPRCTETPDLFA